MNPATTTSRQGKGRPQATVIPFSSDGIRRFRRDETATDAPLGQILLFTGVRYERMPEAPVQATIPQRKRS